MNNLSNPEAAVESPQPASVAQLRQTPPSPTNVRPEEEATVAGIALCLSGGGYRAMLFHAGTMWRLYECGLLHELQRISSVSGGSIAAGLLACKWQALAPQAGDTDAIRRQRFADVYIKEVLRVAGTIIDVPSILLSLTCLVRAATVVAWFLQRFYKHIDLQQLPESPRFVINSTNLQSGALWRFSRPYMQDYRVGVVPNPTVQLATAVAASAAFPPFLAPAVLHFKPGVVQKAKGNDLHFAPFTTKVVLGDGGIYDNMGLETAKQFKTLLVSDGGGHFGPARNIWRNWISILLRSADISDNQVRSLRRRELTQSYLEKSKDGAFWSIWMNAESTCPPSLPCPYTRTSRLAKVLTCLFWFPPGLRRRLINWGYAACDTRIREYYRKTLPVPTGFPMPGGV